MTHNYFHKYQKYKTKYKNLIAGSDNLPLGMVKNQFGVSDLDGKWKDATCVRSGPGYYVKSPNEINNESKCKDQEKKLLDNYQLIKEAYVKYDDGDKYDPSTTQLTEEKRDLLKKYFDYNFGVNVEPKCKFKKNKCYNSLSRISSVKKKFNFVKGSKNIKKEAKEMLIKEEKTIEILEAYQKHQKQQEQTQLKDDEDIFYDTDDGSEDTDDGSEDEFYDSIEDQDILDNMNRLEMILDDIIDDDQDLGREVGLTD